MVEIYCMKFLKNYKKLNKKDERKQFKQISRTLVWVAFLCLLSFIEEQAKSIKKRTVGLSVKCRFKEQAALCTGKHCLCVPCYIMAISLCNTSYEINSNLPGKKSCGKFWSLKNENPFYYEWWMCSFLDNTFWSSCSWNICVLLLYLQGLMEKWLEGVICPLGSKDVQMVLIFTGPRNSFHGLGCCHSGNVYDLLEYIYMPWMSL